VLRSLDGAPFVRYREILGSHEAGEFTIRVDEVPADPFAEPARIRLVGGRATAGLLPEVAGDRDARVGVEDWFARRAVAACSQLGGARPGQPRVCVQEIGSAIVERSACRVLTDTIELRLLVDLPVAAGRIRGPECARLFVEDLPRIATRTLLCSSDAARKARAAAQFAVDHRTLQLQIVERGLVAFLPDGAWLEEGSDSARGTPRRLEAPTSLALHLEREHGGTVRGLAIPAGVTVIVGGAFQGKSALVDALVASVHPHPAGHAWAGIVTHPDAVPIRTEAGRFVHGLDLAAFLDDPPWGARAACFSSDRASAVVSQAAAVAEALEVGARVLLIDEDRSAARWLARDGVMQRLVPRTRDSITPFLERARELYEEWGVSSVVATGAIGDFLQIADTVLCVEDGRPGDVTLHAREIAAATRAFRLREPGRAMRLPAERIPEAPPDAEISRLRASARGRNLRVGSHTIPLDTIDPIVEPGQARALARWLEAVARRIAEGLTVRDLAVAFDEWVDREGLDGLAPPAAYDLTRPRRFELAAVLGRWRALRFRQRLEEGA